MASTQEDLATRKSQVEKAKTDLDAEALRWSSWGSWGLDDVHEQTRGKKNHLERGSERLNSH